MLFQTGVASKAVRIVEAASGRPVIEYGGRRAHGSHAAVYAARAAHIGGCMGTSNVDAACRFGIPVSGTMAHSWVMAHASELDAFRRYLEVYGETSTLLIDTYDPVEAARALSQAGLRPASVRIDSGDLAAVSREVRGILDGGGLGSTKIFASGDLDEDRIRVLLGEGAPIDAFGVGTALTTCSDVPALGGVYKLVEVERDGRRVPTRKLSLQKQTTPGRKQLWRVTGDGIATHDVLGLAGEPAPEGARPLLHCVMRGGRRVGSSPPLSEVRAYRDDAIRCLPTSVRLLEGSARYPVECSERLAGLSRSEAEIRPTS